MATRIKSNQIEDNTIVAADLHSAIAINTTQSGTFGSVIVDTITLDAAKISTTSYACIHESNPWGVAERMEQFGRFCPKQIISKSN